MSFLQLRNPSFRSRLRLYFVFIVLVPMLTMAGVLFPPDSNIGGMGAWQASLANDNSTPVAQGGGFCTM